MELQISYRVCAKVPQESILPREESSNAAAMRMERDKNHRSGSVPQPYSPVCGDTAENLSVALYGVSEREKQHNAV